MFESQRAGITLVLPDNHSIRNEILTTFYRYSKAWLLSALSASPLEVTGLLQGYLDEDQTLELRRNSGMGKGVALEVARMMPQSAREGEKVGSYILCISS